MTLTHAELMAAVSVLAAFTSGAVCACAVYLSRLGRRVNRLEQFSHEHAELTAEMSGGSFQAAFPLPVIGNKPHPYNPQCLCGECNAERERETFARGLGDGVSRGRGPTRGKS